MRNSIVSLNKFQIKLGGKAMKINPEWVVTIEASKLSLEDNFMRHQPSSRNEEIIKSRLEFLISKGIKDFWRFRIDPSFDIDGEVVFLPGCRPAVGKSYAWWEEKANTFLPEHGSRLGTKDEYIAFLGVLIKKLTEKGESVKNAWHMVCNDSAKLGYYESQYRYVKRRGGYRPGDFAHTSNTLACGFFDLANTYKILARNNEGEGFFLAGGPYNELSNVFPLAEIGHFANSDCPIFYGVGWLVLEKWY